jgi:hypothetical protein
VASEYAGDDPTQAPVAESTAAERRAAEEQAFADKLANRPPPNPVEHAEIKKARRRTKARAPSIAMNIEEHGSAGRAFYPDHSDEEGHRYQLADTFGTRSLEFVYSMLNGLGTATANHSLDSDFSPAPANQVAFNAALAVIDACDQKTKSKQCWQREGGRISVAPPRRGYKYATTDQESVDASSG